MVCFTVFIFSLYSVAFLTLRLWLRLYICIYKHNLLLFINRTLEVPMYFSAPDKEG